LAYTIKEKYDRVNIGYDTILVSLYMYVFLDAKRKASFFMRFFAYKEKEGKEMGYKAIKSKYIPTPKEEALLQVLLDPEHIGKSICDKCEIAGVSRTVYYTAMQKPDFLEYYREVSLLALASSTADLLNASQKWAMEEKGHYDRKMLLQILDIYKDKTQTELTGGTGVPLKIQFDIPRPPEDATEATKKNSNSKVLEGDKSPQKADMDATEGEGENDPE
jgi:hypothetical protein